MTPIRILVMLVFLSIVALLMTALLHNSLMDFIGIRPYQMRKWGTGILMWLITTVALWVGVAVMVMSANRAADQERKQKSRQRRLVGAKPKTRSERPHDAPRRQSVM